MFNKKSKQIEQLTNELTELKQQLSIEKSNRIDLNNVNIKLNKELSESQKKLKKYQADFDLKEVNLKLAQAREQLSNTYNKIRENNLSIEQLNSEIITLQDKKCIQSLGLYDIEYNPKYTSVQLVEKLKYLRKQQANELKNKSYYTQVSPFYVDGSESRGRRLVEDLAKNTIRGFNLYTDGLISKLNCINLKHTKECITKTHKNITNDAFSLSNSYLELKLKEIDLSYKICIAKQKEKEERERQKEEIKEQELLAKEIEKEREKLNKDLQHYLIQQKEGNDVIDKIEELTNKINENEYRKERNLAGYVYIIKNNSMPNNLKIGTTRRLDPYERVKELSSASVPFKFYPCAIIFSENAFELESKLHKRFNYCKVNKLNPRKEHFNISPQEVEKVLRKEYSINVEFTYEPFDEEFEFSKNNS